LVAAPFILAAGMGLASLSVVPARASEKLRPVDPRTGMVLVPFSALAAAERKGDAAEVTRVAERVGWSRLVTAATGKDRAEATTALNALPFLPGAVRGIGPLTPLLGSLEGTLAAAAARALGGMLAGVSPATADEWDVAPDVSHAACGGLRTLALRPEAAEEARLASVGALGQGSAVCATWLDLSPLLRDPSPALRRAAALVTRPVERLATAGSPVGVRDLDKNVAGASAAMLCRAWSSPRAGLRGGAHEPIWNQAREVARRLVKDAELAPEDVVDMMSCLDPTSAEDRGLIATLGKHKSPPVKERAKELLERPGQP